MRVAILGGSGFVGRGLVGALTDRGHAPVVISRGTAAAAPELPPGAQTAVADTADPAALAAVLEGADAVVNLAGANVFARRWSKAYRAEIRASRVRVTRALVDALERLQRRPRVLLSGSAVGFYGPRRPGEAVDESTPRAAEFAPGDFLASVCQDWEREAARATLLGVRTVFLRLGVVLGRGDGAYVQLRRITRLFVGGPIAGGRQDVSWVHLADAAGLIVFALETPAVTGALNVTAPTPVTNRELARALGRSLGRPSFVPTPGFALRLGLGRVASMLTEGQRVLPAKAQRLGYAFRFPTLEPALADLERA